MRWPWQRRSAGDGLETRQAPFSEALVAALVQAATGSTAPGDPLALAALEAAAGMWGRAFQAAAIRGAATPATRAVTPAILALIGRQLVRRGEAVLAIEVRGGDVVLIPAASHDVEGGPDPAGWWYRLDLFGPSGNVTRRRPAAAVVHATYAVDPATPWLGVAPLAWARATGTLAANLEARLGEEAGAAVGAFLPVPADQGGADGEATDRHAALKASIRAARGRGVLVETTAAGWGDGRQAAPAADWQQRRFGADPPAPLEALRRAVCAGVAAACGVPVDLLATADGTAQREAYRRFALATIAPALAGLAAELAAKLDAPGLGFDLGALWAHDAVGRSQAYANLAAAGMAPDRAAALAGLA